MKTFNNILLDKSKTFCEDDYLIENDHFNLFQKQIIIKKQKKQNFLEALTQLNHHFNKESHVNPIKIKENYEKNEKLGERFLNNNLRTSQLNQSKYYNSYMSTSNLSILEFSENSREDKLIQRIELSMKYNDKLFNNNKLFHKIKKENRTNNNPNPYSISNTNLYNYSLNNSSKDNNKNIINNKNLKPTNTQSSTCNSKNKNNSSSLCDLDIEIEIPVGGYSHNMSNTNSNSNSDSDTDRNNLYKKLNSVSKEVNQKKKRNQTNNYKDIINDSNKNKDEILVIEEDDDMSQVQNDFEKFNLHFSKHKKIINRNLNQSIKSNITSKSQIKAFQNKDNSVSKSSLLIISSNSILSLSLTPRTKVKKESNNNLNISICNEFRIIEDAFNNDIYNNFYSNKKNIIDINEEEMSPQPLYDIEFIQNLIDTDKAYKPSYQKSNWLLNTDFSSFSEKRMEILDWIMEISEEYGFKRETFHSSINLFDRYFILSNGKETISNMSLVACACMLISSKIEEIQVPHAEEYVNTSNKLFSLSDLLAKEKEILEITSWRINPCTINNWLNWYSSQWDLFVESYTEIYSRMEKDENKFLFKKTDDQSYSLWRQIAQLIDIVVLDIKHIVFDNRALIASSFLILIIYKFNILKEINIDINEDEIIILSEENIKYILLLYSNDNESIELTKIQKNYKDQQNFEKTKDVILLFKEFIHLSFNFTIDDILTSTIYMSQYYSFLHKSNSDLPLCIQMAAEDDSQINNGHYEDFLSYQTHNKNNLLYVKCVFDMGI